MKQKTWQVYSFGKRNVLRFDQKESRDGFWWRGRGRSFCAEGLKMLPYNTLHSLFDVALSHFIYYIHSTWCVFVFLHCIIYLMLSYLTLYNMLIFVLFSQNVTVICVTVCSTTLWACCTTSAATTNWPSPSWSASSPSTRSSLPTLTASWWVCTC